MKRHVRMLSTALTVAALLAASSSVQAGGDPELEGTITKVRVDQMRIWYDCPTKVNWRANLTSDVKVYLNNLETRLENLQVGDRVVVSEVPGERRNRWTVAYRIDVTR